MIRRGDIAIWIFQDGGHPCSTTAMFLFNHCFWRTPFLYNQHLVSLQLLISLFHISVSIFLFSEVSCPFHMAPTVTCLGALWSQKKLYMWLLVCDQNYSEGWRFGETGNSAILSADVKNPIVELNIKWIGYGHLKFSQMWGRSVLNNYILLLTLISYRPTPLRYVRNVAREE